MRHKRTRPKVRIHKDGSITISGLMHYDMRSILTAASLYRYDNKPKPEDHIDNHEWHKRQRYLIDALEYRIEQILHKPYSEQMTSHQPGSKTNKNIRWAALREAIRFREILEEELTALGVDCSQREWPPLNALAKKQKA